MISVVMPAHNAERTIGAQLSALCAQRFGELYEIIVVDDDSTDATRAIVEDAANNDQRVVLVSLTSQGGSYRARNVGATHAKGELLAFCDADDRVEPGWLEALAEAATDADLIGGAVVLAGPAHPGYMAPLDDLPRLMNFLPFAFTANLAVAKSVFQALGGMDDSLRNGGDADFCWRAQLGGFRLGFAPQARVQYRVRSGYRDRFLQSYRYGIVHPLLHRRFRAHGLRKRPWRVIVRDVAGLTANSVRLPRMSYEMRCSWFSGVGTMVGRAGGSLKYRSFWL
jgi:glycosyltransferase involved in cell wall biosynthesis